VFVTGSGIVQQYITLSLPTLVILSLVDVVTAIICINDKNCSLFTVITATYKNTAKIINRGYYPLSLCLNVNMMLSNIPSS